MAMEAHQVSEKYRERDKHRPVIVHCIGLLIQHKTACDDDEAIEAAWDIFDYLGKPETLPVTPEMAARKFEAQFPVKGDELKELVAFRR